MAETEVSCQLRGSHLSLVCGFLCARLSQVEAAKSSLVTAHTEHLQHLAEMAADVARSEQITALTEVWGRGRWGKFLS